MAEPSTVDATWMGEGYGELLVTVTVDGRTASVTVPRSLFVAFRDAIIRATP